MALKTMILPVWMPIGNYLNGASYYFPTSHLGIPLLDDNFTIQNKWTTKRHNNFANNEERPANMPFSI